jgi:hypothetical protein
MFQKIKDLMAGAGDVLGVEIPADFGAVSDAVTQITDVSGVTDAVSGVTDNGIAT